MKLLTRYSEFETRDLDETVAMNRANLRYCSMELRRQGAYYIRVRSAQADLLTVSTVVNRAPVVCRTETDPRSHLLTLRYQGHGECRSGGRVVVDSPGEFRVASPARPAVYTTSGEDQMVVVRIPADLLEREARLLCGQPVDAAPFEIAEPFPAGSPVGYALDRLIQHLNFPTPGHSEERRLAHNLVSLLVATTRNNWQPLSAYTPSAASARRIVWLAEQYLEEHLIDATMGEVADFAGVGLRTLEYAFGQIRERTPVAMRRTLLLDEALRRFLDPTAGATTVRAVAYALGFTNVGRFCEAYAQQFHEHPVATLQRSLRRVRAV